MIDSKIIQWIQQKTISDDNEGHYYADHDVWQVGKTFVFAGQLGETWHSYESSSETRITLNHFVIKKGEIMSFKH